MKITSTITKTGNAQTRMGMYIAKLGRRVEHGLIAAGHALMKFSLEEVPRDTGALADSARISQQGDNLDANIFVGYGGRDIPKKVLWSQSEEEFVERVPHNYALKQHEEDLNHPNGGKWRYLSDPAKQRLHEIREAFRQRFRQGY